MKAVVYHGLNRVYVDTVSDAKLEHKISEK